MAEEATTKGRQKSRQTYVRLSETDLEMARELMSRLNIPTFSSLVRELIYEMYAFLISEQEKDGNHE